MKVRIIRPQQGNKKEVYGITFPLEIGSPLVDNEYNVSKSGTSIILDKQ